jgi:hypothetical protein
MGQDKSVALLEKSAPRSIGSQDDVQASPDLKLSHIIPICSVSGILGMVVGAAGFSSTIAFGTPGEMLSIAPLLTFAVALITGWVGAIYWMCRSREE